jgi:hypothetical protein
VLHHTTTYGVSMDFGQAAFQVMGTSSDLDAAYSMQVDLGYRRDKSAPSFALGLVAMNAGATAPDTLWWSGQLTSATGDKGYWETYEITAEIPSSFSGRQLRVYLFPGSGQPNLDNVRLTEHLAPEPSTVATLTGAVVLAVCLARGRKAKHQP